MEAAFAEADAAEARGEVPVGAVLVDSRTGAILARGHNLTLTQHDPTAHAEIVALRAACAEAGSARLPEADLYVTLEPCAMCAAAIAQARLRRVYFAAYDPKGGAVDHGVRFFEQTSCNHAPETYGGIQERRAGEQLRRFFTARRGTEPSDFEP